MTFLNNNLLKNFDNQILVMIISCAIMGCLLVVLFSKTNLAKIFGMAALSSLVCVIYLLLDAPDVAMTEAAIGACLSTVILLFFAIKIPEYKEKKTTSIYRKFLALCTCLLLAFVFFKINPLLPKIGDITNPINSGAAEYYIKNTSNQIGIPAMVAAILASFRGFDTLLETVVILIAGLAVATILGLRDGTKR